MEGPPAISPIAGKAAKVSATVLTFDAREYLHFLEDCDWTDNQKSEFIEALWQIVVGVVDLGFGLSPFQQLPGGMKMLELDSAAMLASDEISEINNDEVANHSDGMVAREKIHESNDG